MGKSKPLYKLMSLDSFNYIPWPYTSTAWLSRLCGILKGHTICRMDVECMVSRNNWACWRLSFSAIRFEGPAPRCPPESFGSSLIQYVGSLVSWEALLDARSVVKGYHLLKQYIGLHCISTWTYFTNNNTSDLWNIHFWNESNCIVQCIVCMCVSECQCASLPTWFQ